MHYVNDRLDLLCALVGEHVQDPPTESRQAELGYVWQQATNEGNFHNCGSTTEAVELRLFKIYSEAHEKFLIAVAKSSGLSVTSGSNE